MIRSLMPTTAPLPRIPWEALLKQLYEFPPEIMARQPAINFVTALSIVKYYMGEEWVDTHTSPYLNKPGYLRLTVDEGSGEMSAVGGQKLVILGEHLFNLQHIDGFDSCIQRLRHGALESTVAELKLAALFYVNDWEFRFVESVGEKRSDYDYEITLADGLVACADTKCKIESTLLSKNTILNALKKARTQLPDNKPGYVLIKFPADWLKVTEHVQTMAEATNEFFRSNTRVVSVGFYTDPISFDGAIMAVGHQFMEVPNKRNKFDTHRDWRLFEKWRPPLGSANAMPQKWRTLINFPNGL